MKSNIRFLKPLLLSSLAFVNLSSIAQTPALKEKKIALNSDVKITYHVNKNNVKEGLFYIKQAKPEQLLVKGSYTDNKKSGTWYFYNEAGKPETIYSFQQNKLAFIDPELLNKITINLPGQDNQVIESTRIPVLLSPIRLFLSELANNLHIPGEHFAANQALPIKIKAEIDVKGESKYYVIYQHDGKTIDREVKLMKSGFDIEWIPALHNSKPIKSEYILKTELNNPADREDGNSRRVRWTY